MNSSLKSRAEQINNQSNNNFDGNNMSKETGDINRGIIKWQTILIFSVIFLLYLIKNIIFQNNFIKYLMNDV